MSLTASDCSGHLLRSAYASERLSVNDLQAFGLIGELLGARRGAALHVHLRRRVGAVGPDWPQLLMRASEQLVTPALAVAMRRWNLLGHGDEELARYFDGVLDLNRERNRLIHDQVRTIVDVLNSKGIEPIALKGVAYLLMGLFHDPGERVIGDIDLLVPHDHSGEAVEALIGIGYRVADGGEHEHHHHHPALVHGAWPAAVEIHKETVSHLYRRALPAEALVRRARAVTLEERRFGLPCPEDLIVHNIVHSQLANRHFWSAELSLRDAYDLVLLTRRFGKDLDWARLSRRLARDVGSGKVGFYVRQSHRLFGGRSRAPLPHSLGTRIVEVRWALHAAGWFPWLQRATRCLAYQAQACARLSTNALERQRLIRRLFTPP
jgi:hypothetical protein